jgi:TusA-related sulfurtransferase
MTDLDITRDLCPMTFVRTRIALDRLQSGQELRVRLRGEEPRRNVPRSAADQGHTILSIEDAADGTCTLVIRKG